MTLRLYLHNPSTVFAARVNQASFTYPLAECEFDTVGTGAYGDIEIGMTLLFGTSAGEDDLGRQRIRTAADTNTIFFGRSSQGIRDGEVKLQDNAYITILNDYRVWAKIPFIDSDGIMSKDHDIFVDSFTDLNIPPVANAGVGFAATIDSGTSKITASWDASTSSFAVADGESISSYLWDVDDGTITVGSTSTAAITATFPAGFRWVKCTVTDSNSQTHFTRMPVYARNPAGDTTINAFTIDSHRITPQGQQISLRIRETIAENVYPDGTLVMLWEDEPASASDRTHMKFIGWHHTDPATISTQRTGILRDTVLECLDVAGKLDSLPGFPQSLESNVGPTVWTQMSNPNMDKYLHYLLHWHSTALELADWTDSGTGSGFPFVILGSDGESLFDQVDRRCKALVPDYHLVCNTLGQLAVNVDPMLQDSGSRTATIQASLGDIDWMGIQYPHQRPPRFHWLRGNAIKTSTTVISALFCVAPGESPGQGESPQEHGEQLAASQTTLNSCEGHRYARLNAPEGMYSIALAEGDDKDIEPANMAWVRLTITTSPQAAQRNLTFTNERGLVQEINIRYDHQRTGLVKTVELLWERETEGTPAVTVLIPEIEDPYVYNPPDPDPSPGPDDVDLIGDGFGTVYVFLTNKLARTRDFSASPPTWTDITGTVTGNALDWILDPWAPKTRGFALTTSGVWKATGLDGAGTPTWTQVLQSSDVPLGAGYSFANFCYKIQGSINVEDYFVCFARISHASGYAIKCCYTEDAGDTWSFSTVASDVGFPSGLVYLASGFDVVPHLVGGDIRLYAGIYRHYSTEGYFIYRSVNRGATWTNIKNLGYSGRPYGSTCLNTPYKNNEAGTNGWASFPGDNNTNELCHTTDGWATYTRVPFPGIIAEDEWTRVKRLGIEVYIEDENRVMVWLENDHLFYATDAATFTEISYAGYVPGTHGRVSGGGGFPNVNSQFYIVTTSRYVFVSIDGGANWINKTGNLQSVITTNETLAYSLKGVIVPMWLEE